VSDRKIFVDGSFIEWKDRETISYVDGDKSVDVWVDFEPGFFSSGRIVMLPSIDYWIVNATGEKLKITDSEKKAVITKIGEYYSAKKTKFRFCESET
jgi:hypothetical protein